MQRLLTVDDASPGKGRELELIEGPVIIPWNGSSFIVGVIAADSETDDRKYYIFMSTDGRWLSSVVDYSFV